MNIYVHVYKKFLFLNTVWLSFTVPDTPAFVGFTSNPLELCKDEMTKPKQLESRQRSHSEGNVIDTLNNPFHNSSRKSIVRNNNNDNENNSNNNNSCNEDNHNNSNNDESNKISKNDKIKNDNDSECKFTSFLFLFAFLFSAFSLFFSSNLCLLLAMFLFGCHLFFAFFFV